MPLNLIRKIIFANFDIHVCFIFKWYLLTGISLFLSTDICSLVTRHYSWTSFQALRLKHRWVGTPWDEKFSHVNKLTSVFHASVLLLIMNFIITLSFQVHVAVDPRSRRLARWIPTLLWQSYRTVLSCMHYDNRTGQIYALKTDVNLFSTIKNCLLSLIDASHAP